MYDIIAIGELLIDMTAQERKNDLRYIPNPGGAPANFLTIVQLMGGNTSFIGKVGKDYFGKILKECLVKHGVDTTNLIFDNKHPTTLAFVHLTEGESSFSFYRNQTADVMLTSKEVNFDILNNTKAIYFGSLAFASSPLSKTVNKFIKKGKELEKVIFFDVNFRPNLWDNKQKALDLIKEKLSISDVVKLSEEELFLLAEDRNLDKALQIIKTWDIPLVFVTRGISSTIVLFKNKEFRVETVKSTVVDTTGAGDAFFGVVAQKVLSQGCKLENIDEEIIKRATFLANLIASMTITNHGGIPSYPSKETLEEIVRGHNLG